MYNRIDLSQSAIDDKRLFMAYWPGEKMHPEVWTMSTVKEDFGESQQIIEMIMDLAYGEEMYYEEGNLVLFRIPSYLKLNKRKYTKCFDKLKKETT